MNDFLANAFNIALSKQFPQYPKRTMYCDVKVIKVIKGYKKNYFQNNK